MTRLLNESQKAIVIDARRNIIVQPGMSVLVPECQVRLLREHYPHAFIARETLKGSSVLDEIISEWDGKNDA